MFCRSWWLRKNKTRLSRKGVLLALGSNCAFALWPLIPLALSHDTLWRSGTRFQLCSERACVRGTVSGWNRSMYTNPFIRTLSAIFIVSLNLYQGSSKGNNCSCDTSWRGDRLRDATTSAVQGSQTPPNSSAQGQCRCMIALIGCNRVCMLCFVWLGIHAI